MASEHGPFATLNEAATTAAVRSVYAKADKGPRGTLKDGSSQLILDACEAAGVELGDYDRQLIGWLGNWEPHACQVIAGLIHRAAEGKGK